MHARAIPPVLHPHTTAAKAVAQLNKCDTYDLDSARVDGTVSLLKADYSINCASPSYQTMRTISQGFFLAYGVGIPVGFPVVGLLLRQWGGEEMEMDTLAFLFIGFKRVRLLGVVLFFFPNKTYCPARGLHPKKSVHAAYAEMKRFWHFISKRELPQKSKVHAT